MHERQLPRELQERNDGLQPQTNKASASLGVLADWWAVYGQIYRDDPTELLAVAFRETLEQLKPEVLHQSCLIAQRESPQFRPTPGRIYEIAEGILAKSVEGNRPKWLDEPKMSEKDREEACNEPGYLEIRRKITGQ